MKQWSKLIAEYGLQVEWSQERPEPASGIGGMSKPIGVVYVPVGLAGCNGIIRFTVVEQDVPPLLPLGEMGTLQASLDLDDNGDKVIFRQFGGESSLRTLKSGHTAIRADQFDPDGWQLPEITELCQNNDQGGATNYMSVIAHVYQRPRCTDDNTPAGDTDAASTLSRRPLQKTSTNGNGTARPHTTNFPPSSKSQHGLRTRSYEQVSSTERTLVHQKMLTERRATMAREDANPPRSAREWEIIKNMESCLERCGRIPVGI